MNKEEKIFVQKQKKKRWITYINLYNDSCLEILNKYLHIGG